MKFILDLNSESGIEITATRTMKQILIIYNNWAWSNTIKTRGSQRTFRLSLLTNSALLYESKCLGIGGVAVSQPMSTAVHITWHGAQANFWDLTPYLTYGQNCPFHGSTSISLIDFKFYDSFLHSLTIYCNFSVQMFKKAQSNPNNILISNEIIQ